MTFTRPGDTWKVCRLGFHFLIAFATTGLHTQTKPLTDVVVIANLAVNAEVISIDDLRSVFLGTKTSIKDDNRLTPVFERSGPVHNVFLKEYLGKTESAFQIYYRSLVFSGRGAMPTTLASDAEVVAFVEKTHGAIGYVDATALTSGVKRLRVK
jgi:hypothetical protein